MSQPADYVSLYIALARVSEMRSRPYVSDKLWLLAGTLAVQELLPRTAAECRARVLRHNPQHLLGHWPTFEQAVRQADFQALWKRTDQQYPRELAEHMWNQLLADDPNDWDRLASRKTRLATLLQIDAVNLDECLE